jgi:hypothetical protein
MMDFDAATYQQTRLPGFHTATLMICHISLPARSFHHG